MKPLLRPAPDLAVASFGGWTLYERNAAGKSLLWIQFKLVCPSGTPRCRGRLRSFYLAWNVLEQRLARTSYGRRLAAENPAVSQDVEIFLGQHYDRAWLERFATPEEIALAEHREALRIADRRARAGAA